MSEKYNKIIERVKKDKILMATVATFLIFAVTYVGTLGFINLVYKDKAVWGMKINDISVQGKTSDEIKNLLRTKKEKYERGSISIEAGGDAWVVQISDLDPDYKLDEVSEKAVSFGKMTFDITDVFGSNISVFPKLNDEKVGELSRDIVVKKSQPVSNASVKLEGKALSITEGSAGERVSVEGVRVALAEAAKDFKNTAKVEVEALEPNIQKADIEFIRYDIDKFLEKPLAIKADTFLDDISKEILLSWLDFERISETSVVESEGLYPDEKTKDTVGLKIKREAIEDYVRVVADNVQLEAQNAVLSITDGRATAFQLSRDGKKLDEEEAINKILGEALLKEEISLPVETIKAEVNEDNLGNLGIKELVASGTSNFSGSSSSRKHNIRVGASKFDGVLIKPGEIFSFNKYLGEVDARNGYLPELVILEDKTTPQYGGGLCQVSSTAFRVALNAGLPIEARKNHSYPVKYYYPIGADATIYLPNPDLKFKNDTANYILIQTSMYGNTLQFDFYGTKPARTVKFTGNADGTNAVANVEKVKPYLYNWNAKGPGSVDSIFYRFIYDNAGNLIDTYKNVSKYNSPDKYPKVLEGGDEA